eukprot:1138409-Pelagomonas_calceolata.AAC.4
MAKQTTGHKRQYGRSTHHTSNLACKLTHAQLPLACTKLASQFCHTKRGPKGAVKHASAECALVERSTMIWHLQLSAAKCRCGDDFMLKPAAPAPPACQPRPSSSRPWAGLACPCPGGPPPHHRGQPA